MRPFAISALILGCSALLPSTARADCITPEHCVCAGRDPNTILDAIIQPGTTPDTVRLEVLQTYGEPIEVPDDGVIELPNLSVAIDGEHAGKRALVYVDVAGVRERVLLDASENLECTDLDAPMGADEGAQLALMGWDACSAAVREREGLSGTCDDTARCSMGSRAPMGSLVMLGLLGLVRRRHRHGHWPSP